MKELVEGIIELLEHKESFALATIIVQQGSAPRNVGTHMVIRQDGSMLGTIGGGVMEALTKQHAAHVIEDQMMFELNLDLNCHQAAEINMICGGQVQVLINFIDAKEPGYLNIYREIISSLKLGQQVWLITSLVPNKSDHRTKQCLVKDAGEHLLLAGGFPNGLDSLLPQIRNIHTFTHLDELQLMVEPLAGFGTAYVFGAGHIAYKLAPLLNMVNISTVVIDDRARYANKERFGTADKLLVCDFSSAFTKLDINEHSYIIIITRGHLHDKLVLAQALRTKAGYIGMIGSRSKRNTIYRSLIDEGFSVVDLQRVYSPIGLKIGADSPEEIAISIAAELIKYRADKNRSSKGIRPLHSQEPTL